MIETKPAKPQATQAKGRPAGAGNRKVTQTEGTLTRCPKCDSTSREPYFNRRELAIAGVDPATEKPYTSIVIRRTSCSDCGQHRDDRHYEFQPPKK